MRNYTVYDALTNWKLREKAKMAAGLLMVHAAPNAYAWRQRPELKRDRPARHLTGNGGERRQNGEIADARRRLFLLRNKPL